MLHRRVQKWPLSGKGAKCPQARDRHIVEPLRVQSSPNNFVGWDAATLRCSVNGIAVVPGDEPHEAVVKRMAIQPSIPRVVDRVISPLSNSQV